MKNFIYFALSSGSWLVLYYVSNYLSIGTATDISFIRASSLAIAAFYMLMRYKKLKFCGDLNIITVLLMLLIVPMLSSFLLNKGISFFLVLAFSLVFFIGYLSLTVKSLIASDDYVILVDVLTPFYFAIFAFLFAVSKFYGAYFVLLTVIITLIVVGYLRRRANERELGNQTGSLKLLFVNSPAIILSPLVLIFMRDTISLEDSGSSSLSADYFRESVGMLINGVGGALWSSLVHNYRHKLKSKVVYTMLFAVLSLLVSLYFDTGFIYIVLLLLTLEFIRGGQWLLVSIVQLTRGDMFSFCFISLAQILTIVSLVFSVLYFNGEYLYLFLFFNTFILIVFSFIKRARRYA